ncbi:aldehyde dehydrogenase family protein [Nocardia pseudobrasiliensis]|uniref:Aldehyde dehydrogenase n=1 Tax=Nocardia pseudobrasiliensis TaxID=45979 RepID=A0A370ICE8_9NOCA|nr:aldehyde dehydrogenase family protein [Nocardia pseudobrasiliensis]RDI68396.1 aldehyde dehydrogenase (NAD+) [Nocardia pseudobrasiliensis]
MTENYSTVVDRLRSAVRSGRTRPLEWRTEQLRRLRALLSERGSELADAMFADLHKSESEGNTYEIEVVIREIDHTLTHLESWLRPEPVELSGYDFAAGSTAVTRYDPLGVVLVIGTWNYPVQLLLLPIAGALAAGNTVVAKPSDVAPATSAAVARLLPQYFDPDTMVVVEGGRSATDALLAERFDHIFFTGGAAVGRVVMKAAAAHLTPVTLELGGKSPVFIDRDVDLAAVAERLVWAKFNNAGQVCVTTDYVLTDPDTARGLESALAAAVTDRFGDDPATSPKYGRIVNERHFDRLTALLESGRTVVGGQHDRAQRYIAPTVLASVTADSPVMQEEIFGPILPIVEVPDLDKALEFINNHDKPLALYAFTDSDTTRERLATETSSGGVAFGLPLVQLLVHDLPFGGVGASGLGNYHGRYSIETFSHRKAVVDAKQSCIVP